MREQKEGWRKGELKEKRERTKRGEEEERIIKRERE